MSKIDLSKAKIGDKFRDRHGCLHELIYILKGDCYFPCLLVNETKDTVNNYKFDGSYLQDNKSKLDLIEQVFDDEKDRVITDKILKDVEKVVNGVTQAMPLIESATIANLYREPLPENNEDNSELQRRQEVVELAEKMYILFENTRCHLSCTGSDTYCSEDLKGMAFVRAAYFVNKKHEYLKEGKL